MKLRNNIFPVYKKDFDGPERCMMFIILPFTFFFLFLYIWYSSYTKIILFYNVICDLQAISVSCILKFKINGKTQMKSQINPFNRYKIIKFLYPSYSLCCKRGSSNDFSHFYTLRSKNLKSCYLYFFPQKWRFF